MAKITIVGNAVVITSTLKLEEIYRVKKYRPDALTLKGGEDGKEPIFCIGVGSVGKINQYGAEFDGETHDERKLATITLLLDGFGETEDLKEFIADGIGAWVATLGKLEAQIPAVLEEIDAERAEIMANITVQ